MNFFFKAAINLLFIFVLINDSAIAQNISARYAVVETINASGNSNLYNKTIQLNYEGFFYKSGGTYISYLKPLYLDKYPEGYVMLRTETSSGTMNANSYVLTMDTVQHINYVSMDSLIIRSRMNANSYKVNKLPNTCRSFEIDYQQWKILPETKTIQGLRCQRAKRVDASGKVYYDVWFCADLPTECNYNAIIGLPGLIVEGDCIPWNQHFSLMSYEWNNEVVAKVFWPAEFNEGFRTQSPFKRQW